MEGMNLHLPLLKIGNLVPKYPIIQGGMSIKVSTASLAAAVAKAGGIGVIGGTGISTEELKSELRSARDLAGGGILGVNIMFAAHNFKEFVQTAIEEAIDVIFTGAGFSRDIFEMGRNSGTPIVPIVSSARAALIAQKSGAAAVVAEGTEAGGHLGTDRSIKEILPEIKQAVNLPVIAAGGITDGYDMAEMIKLGADGIQMATRFVLSDECSVADEYKQVYLDAREEDIVIVKSPVGLPGRAIRNKFSDMLAQNIEPPKSECTKCLKQCSHVYCIKKALLEARNSHIENGLVFAGKNVFKIKDILPVQQIFQNILSQYASA
jgi:NAD(P)H-dependent flavin oxidoreductase YrpB (nitropropane dioxygenase family)